MKLNAWEQQVLDTEIGRPSFVAWYRNPSRAAASALRIGYVDDNDNWQSLQVDFVVVSKRDDGTLAAAIVDPHGDHLADAVPKLKALARYAEHFGDHFVRIVSIAAPGGGELRSLDLLNSKVRAAVLAYDGSEGDGPVRRHDAVSAIPVGDATPLAAALLIYLLMRQVYGTCATCATCASNPAQPRRVRDVREVRYFGEPVAPVAPVAGSPNLRTTRTLRTSETPRATSKVHPKRVGFDRRATRERRTSEISRPFQAGNFRHERNFEGEEQPR